MWQNTRMQQCKPNIFWLFSYSHTIATTSRRPLTTTFFWVVAGGCQRSANVCRWSPTSRRLVVRELHRQPLADLRQPLFWGVFFGGIRWSANDCRWSPTSRRLVGDWLSEQLVGERFSLQHRKPFADQTSWALAVHRPWIWIKMVWAFSTHIVYFRFARPQARENRWCAQFGMSARACLLSVY